MKNRKRTLPFMLGVGILLVGFFIVNCSIFKKKDKDNDAPPAAETEDPVDETGTLSIDDNALAASYPVGLAMSAFPQEVDSETAAVTGTIAISADTALALTTGNDDMCPDSAGGFDPANPFGSCIETPEQAYTYIGKTKLPDKMFTDKPASMKIKNSLEVVSRGEDCVTESTMGILATFFMKSSDEFSAAGCFHGDYGIVRGTYSETSDEACLVGVSREQVSEGVVNIDFATTIIESALCQAKIDGIADDEIEPGASLDISGSINSAFSDAPAPPAGEAPSITASSATIARSSSGDTYTTAFEIKFVDPSGAIDRTYEVSMVKTLSGADINYYSGSLIIKNRVIDIPKPGDPPDDGLNPMDKYIAINFDRSEGTADFAHLKIDMKTAKFTASRDPRTSDNTLDFNTGALFTSDPGSWDYGKLNPASTQMGSSPDFSKENEMLRDIRFVKYSGYPAANIGRIAYWWNPGSNYNENPRGYVFDTQLVEGQIKGCAYAGAAYAANVNEVGTTSSIRKSLKEGIDIKIRGFLRPNFCDKSCGDMTWRQCFKQNASTGVYEIDLDATTDDASGFDFIAAPSGGIGIEDVL